MTKEQRHAEWAKKIDAQRRSGLNMRKWCLQQSINEKTFSRWKRTLKTEKQSKPPPPEGWCQVQTKPAVEKPTCLKLVVNNQITIELVPGFNPELLREILAVLCP